ncbi:MAG: RsmE family RNA methyltransferase [Candidatus Gastranaerophilaceae bacterium]|nr:RsmE family RNA methyltransferase [Candidatus Gastranaerophilaceae bacterium]
MPHFFIKSENISEKLITIKDPDNYRHIAKSLRAKNGEKILLIDENKIQYEGEITDITTKEILVKRIKSYPSKRYLNFKLYLAQSPLRSDAQTTIIEKATELGVDGIYPIYTDNCALNKTVINKKTEKWQKTMYEASKQCERAEIPKCFELTDIKTLSESGDFDYIIAFCERNTDTTLRKFIETNNKIFTKNSKLLVIIGPEGGFSQREFDYFKNNKIPMLTLGNLILKAETAVITALGNLVYEYNYSRKN